MFINSAQCVYLLRPTETAIFCVLRILRGQNTLFNLRAVQFAHSLNNGEGRIWLDFILLAKLYVGLLHI
jgi:hypothetical protein